MRSYSKLQFKKCNLTLKWAHLPMPRRLAICRLKKSTMCFVPLYPPLSLNTGTPCCFNIHYGSLQFPILAKCKLVETCNMQTHNFLSMDVTLRREPKRLLEFRSSCDGSGLNKLYIAICMTSVCLFSKHNCWSKVGNMPATVQLVKQITSWSWLLVQWHWTDGQKAVHKSPPCTSTGVLNKKLTCQGHNYMLGIDRILWHFDGIGIRSPGDVIKSHGLWSS